MTLSDGRIGQRSVGHDRFGDAWTGFSALMWSLSYILLGNTFMVLGILNPGVEMPGGAPARMAIMLNHMITIFDMYCFFLSILSDYLAVCKTKQSEIKIKLQ